MDSVTDVLRWIFDTPRPGWDALTAIVLLVGIPWMIYHLIKERVAERRRPGSASLNIPTDLEDYDG